MKKNLRLLLFSLVFSQVLNSQPVVTQGKPLAEIFTDFHCNINDTSKTTGFGINRAYLGYNFLAAGDFSSTIVLNVGSPEDLPSGSMHRRYMFIREASLAWTKDRFNLTFGVISTRLWEFQQRFWGKRYVANTYQSLNGYGFVADLGFSFGYKFNDIIKADIYFMNGEGYSDLQLDNSIKTSASVLITPTPQVAIRFYADISRPGGVLQNTLVGFAGFKNDLITIGAEVSYKTGLDLTAGHTGWGISGTGAVSIFNKTQFFVRLDYSTSVKVPGEVMQWNYHKDGKFAVGGFEYAFNQNVKVALDYQGTFPFNPEKKNSDAIYFNTLFKF